MKTHLWLTLLFLCFLTVNGWAQTGPAGDEEPLPAEEAFIGVIKSLDADHIQLIWTIADGYYMYREKFKFSSQTQDVTLGEPAFPHGKIKQDEFFGKIETYRHRVEITIPITRQDGVGELAVATVSQGCADIGVCYQPIKNTLKVALPTAAGQKPALKKLADLGKQLGLTEQEKPFLEANQAFMFTAEVVDANTIKARWDIADGYYLYKSKFKFHADPDINVEQVTLPTGDKKHDDYFGDMEVYHHQVEALLRLDKGAPQVAKVLLNVAYQGCAEAGYCYPPLKSSSQLNLADAGAVGMPLGAGSQGASPTGSGSFLDVFYNAYYFISDTEQLRTVLSGRNYLLVVPLFFSLGLLLAFTPCVFPMVPILSSIIAGEGSDVTTRRAFTMSLVYVLAMAVTYTSLGVIAGMAGQALDAMFQNPWILSVFAAIFVALSLSMFGYYDLQMPSSWQSRLAEISNKQQGGKLVGVAIMGFLSALIVGPCVAAPLAAIIILIADQQDPIYGATVLFSMTLGMGAPLLLIGTAAGKYLPRAGGWMGTVKGVFGLMLLGLSVYFLSRFIMPPLINYLWIVWIIGSVIYLTEIIKLKPDARLGQKLNKYGWTAGCAVLAYVLVIGVQSFPAGVDSARTTSPSARQDKQSASGVYRREDSVAGMPVIKVKGLKHTQAVIKEANAQGKGVFVDVFADWCIYCKRMDSTTFADQMVQQKLSDFVILKIDITDDDDINRELRKHYRLITPPPVYIFFDKQGKEIEGTRMYGFKNVEQFMRKLKLAGEKA